MVKKEKFVFYVYVVLVELFGIVLLEQSVVFLF